MKNKITMSQDKLSQDKLSQDKFDEMDELALSLQKQIQELDNIPDFEPQVDKEHPQENESISDTSILDDVYQPSPKVSVFGVDSPEKDNSQHIKKQIQEKLSEQTIGNRKYPPSIFRLKLLIPIIIGLFFIVSATTYWLLNNNTQEITQSMEISLPSKLTPLLDSFSDSEIVSLDIREEDVNSVINGSVVEGAEHLIIKDTRLEIDEQEGKPLRKIPLVFIDELDNPEKTEMNEKPLAEVNNKPLAETSKDNSVNKEQLTSAKGKSNQNSNLPKTKIIKPSINKISPSPVIGNNKRQWIDIKGSYFNEQTILNLQWKDKGKQQHKLFVSSMGSAQLKFLSPSHMRLHINTGTAEKIWKLKLVNQNKESDNYEFRVVAPFNSVKQSPAKSSVKKVINSQTKHAQAVNSSQKKSGESYTLQLLASSSYGAIQDVMKKHQKYKQLSWHKILRKKTNWYVLTYGNFTSKQQALLAYKKLPKSLRSTKPWVRKVSIVKQNIIKEKSKLKIKKARIITTKPAEIKNNLSNMYKAIKMIPSNKWGYQLISLGSEKSMIAYVKKHDLVKKSNYFEREVNGTKRYTLVYGLFNTKQQAKDEIKKLPLIIRQGKPWVRSYFDIQKLMN